MKSVEISEKAPVGKYYKALSEVNGRFLSCSVENKAEVSYIIDTWVRAPSWLACRGYHLFVYDDLENARWVVNNNIRLPKKAEQIMHGAPISGDKAISYLRIYECEVQGVCSRLPQPLGLAKLGEGEIELSDTAFPGGTVMVKGVKLLREVKK